MVGTPRCSVRSAQRAYPTKMKFMNETLKNKQGWRVFRQMSNRPILSFSCLTVFLFLVRIGLSIVADYVQRGPNWIVYAFVYIILGLQVLLVLSFFGFIFSLIPRTRPFTAWLLCDFWFWLFTWQGMRRTLAGLAILATLTAIFYSEEDWRSKRAWDNCKRELEAKGEVLDWSAYIPPPVPDDQNFFKAPKMAAWFVKLPAMPNQWLSTNDFKEAAEFSKRLQANKSTSATITTESAARDYLGWSDKLQPELDEIREALKRPCAIIPGDYSNPPVVPMPNFVQVRAVAQMLVQRTKCYLLLGQPDKALQELTLLNDSRRLLEAAPAGKPMTLVSAMINVAISGMYVDTVAYGLQQHAWQEPQLAALQQQLKGINLTPFVAAAFEEEDAARTHAFEADSVYKNVNLLSLYSMAVMFDDASDSDTGTFLQRIKFWQRLKNSAFMYLELAPSGWRYQNQVTCAKIESRTLDGFDLEHDTISPRIFDEVGRTVNQFSSHRTPFNLWAAIVVPNVTKATQALAHNQTMVNEAQIACALERYRLTHGELSRNARRARAAIHRKIAARHHRRPAAALPAD